jgi:hypothetical protein
LYCAGQHAKIDDTMVRIPPIGDFTEIAGLDDRWIADARDIE